MRRLRSKESAMGVGLLRNLHVLRVLREAPRTRRTHLLRQIRHHGLMVRDPDQEDGSGRQRAAQQLPRAIRNRQGDGYRLQVQFQRRLRVS